MNAISFDEVILDHCAWSARFRSVQSGFSTERFKLDEVRDDSSCRFGRWLSVGAAEFANPATFAHINALHKTFHEIAWQIAVMLTEGRAKADVDLYLAEFDSLSKQLVSTLRAGKSNLACSCKVAQMPRRDFRLQPGQAQ